jgi:tetratricopeptide (TPR) repeat protein
MESKDLGKWLQQIAGGVTAVTGFIAGLVGFAQLVQGEAGLVTLLLLGLGIGLIWLACLYFARFWQPEKQDKAPGGIQPPPTTAQEQALARRVRQRKAVRRSARVGLVLVPLLVLAGYFGWQHVQSLPSKEVVILVAEFDGPEGQNYRVTETILSQLRDATEEYPDVRVEALEEPVTERMGSAAARELGENRKASIIIWGWYGKTDTDVPISVNFEVLQPPEDLPEFDETASGAVQTFAISELNSFQIQTRLSSEMAYLTLFTLGVARFAAADWAGAIARFNDALEQSQSFMTSLDVSTIHYFKGAAYNNFKGDYENSIAAFDATLALNPNDPIAFYNKGIALDHLGRYEEAIAAYDAALALDPDDPSTLNNKGIALDHLKRYEEAIAAYDAALALIPDHPAALSNKGSSLADLGRHEEAIAAYDAALALIPDYTSALYNKGNSLADLGRYEEAIAAYDAALALNQDYPDVSYNKGIVLDDLGRYEEAIASYDAALSLNPDDPSALNNKGNSLADLKRYEEAIAAYDAALVLDGRKEPTIKG